MKLKRYFVEGLAHASYLIGSGSEAAVVDPKRDVDDYIADADAMGMKIKAIFNTHPHADFASGFSELAQRTGAKVYVSHVAPVTYRHIATGDGESVRIGSLVVDMLETPGHSPDSLSFLVKEDDEPQAVFTGDLLFVGDVGRPDLRDADEDPEMLAGKLYDSLFGKILSLPDDVKIYPAHGAGSLCGRKISSAPYSTVAEEKANNWAARITDAGEFVKEMVANLPARPAYFSFDVGVNLAGAPPLGDVPDVPELGEDDLRELAAAGATVIDTRTASDFGAGHFRGSLNIGIKSPMFSTWVGFLIPGGAPIVLVVESSEDAAKARLELARIGFDSLVGFVEARRLTEMAQLTQTSVCDLRSELAGSTPPFLLDVRTPGEWRGSHIEHSVPIPLPDLPRRMDEIAGECSVAVICGSGYRSSIAASYLESKGMTRLQNVMGGMGAFLEVDCPRMNPAELVFSDASCN